MAAAAIGVLGVAVAAGVVWLNGSSARDREMAQPSLPAAVLDEPPGDVELQPLEAAGSDLGTLRASATDTAAARTESLAGRPQASRPEPAATLREDAALRRARQVAEAAWEQAARARATAGGAGADSLHVDQFAEADAQFSRAVAALRAGQFRLALLDFEAAGRRFEDLAVAAEEQLRAPPASVGAELGESEAAPPDQQDPEVESEALAPEAIIAALVEAYRQGIEVEDLNSLSAQVYRGEIPADNREFLEEVFRRADGLAVTIDVEKLELVGDSARARVKQSMQYRLTATRQRRDFDLSLELFFERAGEGWRLRRFDR